MIGLGWAKTVYGNVEMSMTTDASAITREGALCGDFFEYGGFVFTASPPNPGDRILTFAASTALQFYARSNISDPAVLVSLESNTDGGCNRGVSFSRGATNDVTSDGYHRYYFPLSVWMCDGMVLADANRVSWQNRESGGVQLCARDIRLIE